MRATVAAISFLSLTSCVNDQFIAMPGRTPDLSAYHANIECGKLVRYDDVGAIGAGALGGAAGGALFAAFQDHTEQLRPYYACMAQHGWIDPSKPNTALQPVAVQETASVSPPVSRADSTNADVGETLEKVKGLYDQHLITKDEYDAKRKQLLEKIR